LLDLCFTLQVDDQPWLHARLYVWGSVEVLCRHFVFVEQISVDFGVVELSFLSSESDNAVHDAEAFANALLLSGVEVLGRGDQTHADSIRRLRHPVSRVLWNLVPADFAISPVGACR